MKSEPENKTVSGSLLDLDNIINNTNSENKNQEQEKKGFNFIKKANPQQNENNSGVQQDRISPPKQGFSFIKNKQKDSTQSNIVSADTNKKGEINFDEIFSSNSTSSHINSQNNNNLINSLNSLDLTKGK
jgi:hypothetical protein